MGLTAAGLLRLLALAVALGVGAMSALMVWAQAAGRPGLALAAGMVLALVLALHPTVLALETLLAWREAQRGPGPRAGWRVWVAAWAAEVPVSLRAFAWRMPWRAQAQPDHLPPDAAGRRGVLLVHGYLCNRGLWNGWLERLRRRGVPVVAVNLEPVLGRIEQTVPALEAGMRRLEACTGVPPVVVAHSMGGLALRCWWAAHDGDVRIHHAITIATPHRGTVLARFGLSPNARQMRPGSRWLQALAAAEPADRAARCTCLLAGCDNVVFPAALAVWPGAAAAMVEGAAHLDLIDRPQAWAALERALAG